MKMRYSREQLSHIREQALLFQCACPAQVSQMLSSLLALHQYQSDCQNETDVDLRVHRRIADAAADAYVLMEQCLIEILELEGWDMATLNMPESLKKKMLSDLG